MAINWSIAQQQPNALAMMLQGFEEGKQMRREEAGRNAMARIMGAGQTPGIGDGQAPQDMTADWEAVGQWKPELAYQLKRDQEERAWKIREQLATLGERERELENTRWKAAAPLLVQMQSVPYEQRRGLLQSAAPVLMANGWSNEQLSRFDPTDDQLQGLIAVSKTVEQAISANEPKYMAIPQGGTLVNTRDPQAVSSFGATPPPAQPQPAQPASMSAQDALRNATGRGFVLPDEVQAIKSQLGPNGQATFEGWLKQNNVKVVTRTGTDASGRKVVQFEDGTIQYAD